MTAKQTRKTIGYFINTPILAFVYGLIAYAVIETDFYQELWNFKYTKPVMPFVIGVMLLSLAIVGYNDFRTFFPKKTKK